MLTKYYNDALFWFLERLIHICCSMYWPIFKRKKYFKKNLPFTKKKKLPFKKTFENGEFHLGFKIQVEFLFFIPSSIGLSPPQSLSLRPYDGFNSLTFILWFILLFYFFVCFDFVIFIFQTCFLPSSLWQAQVPSQNWALDVHII